MPVLTRKLVNSPSSSGTSLKARRASSSGRSPTRIVDGTICWQNVVCALALDNFVLAPCIYYPAFYLFKSAAAGCFSVRTPLQQYRKEFWPQMKALWSLWIPAGLINLTMIPPPSRAAFNGAVGLIWVVILSLVTTRSA